MKLPQRNMPLTNHPNHTTAPPIDLFLALSCTASSGVACSQIANSTGGLAGEGPIFLQANA